MPCNRKTNCHLPVRMYLKAGRYYYVSPENKWISLSTVYRDALIQYAELSSIQTSGTMAELIKRYAKDVIPTKAQNSQNNNRSAIIRLLEVFGKMKAKSVKPRQIADYLEIRSESAPVGANRDLSLLSHIFTKGIKWGFVETNPCRDIEKNPEQARDRYIEDKEFWDVYRIASSFIQNMMLLCLLTAQSRCDLLKLRREHIKEDGIHFGIRQKNINRKKKPSQKCLVVVWNANLKSLVARILEQLPDNAFYLFSDENGKPYNNSNFKYEWDLAMKEFEKGGGENFHFHDIRAKSITDGEEQGLDGQERADHSSQAMTDIYRRKKHFKYVEALDFEFR